MLETQVMEFVESVEPDFKYQGTDGMMNIISESAYNMVLMESAIRGTEYEAIQEGAIGDFFGGIWNRIKKFFSWILGIIKKMIGKIKGFFIKCRQKLTMAAAAAMRKIGKTIASNVNMDKQGGDKEAIKYVAINNTNLKKICNNIEAITIKKDNSKEYNNTSILDKLSVEVLNNINFGNTANDPGNVDVDKLDSEIKDYKDKVKDEADRAIEGLKKTYTDAIFEGITEFYGNGKKDEDNIITSVKAACLVEKEITPSKEEFKKVYSSEIVKSIDSSYKSVMKAYSSELLNMNEIQKKYNDSLKKFIAGLEKKVKEFTDTSNDDKKKRQVGSIPSKVKSLFNYQLSECFRIINAGTSMSHMCISKAAQAIASASMTSYKSLLSVTLIAVGRRIRYSKPKNESYNFL